MKNIAIYLSALVALLFSVAETSAQITPPYYNPANVAITGGNINNTVIGGTTPAAGSFTALSATSTLSTSTKLDIRANATSYVDAKGIYLANAGNTRAHSLYVNNSSGSLELDVYNGSAWTENVLAVSSTGLAVTGALSASGAVSGIVDGSDSASGQLLFRNVANDAAANWQLSAAGSAALWTYVLGPGWGKRLDVSSTALTLGTGVNLVTAANVIFGKTITAGGTTGNQTINKTTGRVNFAAAATSLVVTNSFVTANSIIHCTVATNDTTMKSASCVPAAGSFTIRGNANPTAETAVAFTVTN